MNTIRTLVLLGVLTGLMVAIGSFIGGERGMWSAFLIAIATNVGSYWFSDKIALAMSGAQPVSEQEAPELYDIVRGLTEKANLPMPAIYIIPSQSPNAFATGRDANHAAVAVTEGILQIMNRKELEAVLGHELGHVRNHDILITSIAAVLASTITMLAHWAMYWGGYSDDQEGKANPIMVFLLAILAPIAASIINLAISRAREYQADATGAQITGEPLQLAHALAKLESGSERMPMRGVNPALSSLFLVKPDPQSFFVNLFSTHPPIPDRIERLQKMARQMQEEG
jgi:heat shock protein HtpX